MPVMKVKQTQVGLPENLDQDRYLEYACSGYQHIRIDRYFLSGLKISCHDGKGAIAAVQNIFKDSLELIHCNILLIHYLLEMPRITCGF
jgi:hypothetical protein